MRETKQVSVWIEVRSNCNASHQRDESVNGGRWVRLHLNFYFIPPRDSQLSGQMHKSHNVLVFILLTVLCFSLTQPVHQKFHWFLKRHGFKRKLWISARNLERTTDSHVQICMWNKNGAKFSPFWSFSAIFPR